MAGASLLTLLDDIATVLDDVAVMSKVAARKTAGVLGDDLALNAEQVSGVRAEREIPVVWAVAKGSFRNKLILVPAALLISAFIPWLITPLLMLGGAFLCYEGFEKVAHKYLHSAEEDAAARQKISQALNDPSTDMVSFEREKIRGAIRTDFILSAEIIVIALGTVQQAELITQIMVISTIALLMTVGVYSLVAGIVKLDDAGLWLVNRAERDQNGGLQRWFGEQLLAFAPRLMKLLTVVGTIAMFMVGGGILMHGIPGSHELIHPVTEAVASIAAIGPLLAVLTPTLLNALAGLIAGGLILLLLSGAKKLTGN
ncbi:DUF808 domain-containing protein [Marinobacterium jannaschii]|uniref:DUF808 domain-containing protein n=1 Tax=Marinobacterium jannaschii TaxID=64970 RepID=UPI000484CDE6|nr:DUF808 domain-containing protein [Marinobacterium jannaschii]